MKATKEQFDQAKQQFLEEAVPVVKQYLGHSATGALVEALREMMGTVFEKGWDAREKLETLEKA